MRLKLHNTMILAAGLILLISSTGMANTNEENLIGNELQKIKYDLAFAASEGTLGLDEFDDDLNEQGIGGSSGYKSPGKAFLLSLAVPGLGQYYYGSKVKPIAFVGVEAASWILHLSWHNKGNDLTDEFEAFNHAHWSQTRYEDYLEIVYGVRDDENIPDSIPHTEVSHNLPDTKTQQYYEMTGKYNQFAWGWDDAITLPDSVQYGDWATSPPSAITNDPATIPHSSLRLQYETMRNDANKKLDNANKMLMVVLANHLISAVEAYISTKARNESAGGKSEFSKFKFKPLIKSYNSRSDTPYMNVSYKF